MNSAIILSGGEGVRFGEKKPKQLSKLAGRTILEHTVKIFAKNKNINEIIIVIHPKFYNFTKKLITKKNLKKKIRFVKGGRTRQESSKLGIMSCKKNTKKLLIHDAVRPFLSDKIINDCLEALRFYSAVDVAIRLSDTLIKVNDKNEIVEIPRRDEFRRGQTPQAFRYAVIKKAHKIADEKKDKDFTDDCGLILRYNLGKIFVVEGEEKNMKITYPIDLHIADKLFQLNHIDIKDENGFLGKLTGKKVIIFGATSGIGLEVYKMCKKSKAIVEGYSKSKGLDIRDYENVRTALNTFVLKHGKIDIFISTVGILERGILEDFSNSSIEEQVSTNFTSQAIAIKEVIKLMAKNGNILLFTSSSYTRGRETYSIYSATKAALVNFIQAVSEEIVNKNIKINAICPDRTDTPMRRRNFGIESSGTLLNPSRVASVALSIAISDLTGQVINIRIEDGKK